VRLAWVSPLPPVPSGIADYSAEILPVLAEEAEIHVFSPQSGRKRHPRNLQGLEIHPSNRLRRMASQYDAIFYHLGNNPYHGYVYLAARKQPGICVFHDSVLHHLISYIFTEKDPNWDEYRAILREEYGATGEVVVDLRRRRLTSAMEYFLFPLTAHVARRARAIVVHSEDVSEEMAEVAPAIPITVIPHHAGTVPPGMDSVNRETARARLGLPRDAFLVGHLGFITVPKQPLTVLRGFAELVKRRPEAMLLFVGEKQLPGRGLERSIEALGLKDRVRIVGFVDLPTFYLYVKAIDVVVNLRYPSAGETSGTLARALAQGRAVIVNNVGSFARIPSDVVLKVEVDQDQADQVGSHLIRLAQNPPLKAALEQRARLYAATELDQRRCAQLYLEVAREVAGSRAPARESS
jgi:glycosyltransferase involved in cell wall biosynthesis